MDCQCTLLTSRKTIRGLSLSIHGLSSSMFTPDAREARGRNFTLRRATSRAKRSCSNVPIMKKFALIAAVLLSALPILAASKAVDIVIAHGTVLTMAGPNIEDGAVAIEKGSIVAVGAASKITAAYHGRETIN